MRECVTQEAEKRENVCAGVAPIGAVRARRLPRVLAAAFRLFSSVLVALLSLPFLALLDGMLMLLCNNDIQPACVASKNLHKKSSVISISGGEFRA
ncbi:unnamed protein product [Caenorhabditis sp. 36 PRJEB53466]|nr:unnamed protein product [Caenorhabditis sp. 36 PRJEB53466]